MPEEQAFSVLVKICFDYELRDLFKQGFEVLHLKFYQLERLMQVSQVPYIFDIVLSLCSPLFQFDYRNAREKQW